MTSHALQRGPAARTFNVATDRSASQPAPCAYPGGFNGRLLPGRRDRRRRERTQVVNSGAPTGVARSTTAVSSHARPRTGTPPGRIAVPSTSSVATAFNASGSPSAAVRLAAPREVEEAPASVSPRWCLGCGMDHALTRRPLGRLDHRLVFPISASREQRHGGVVRGGGAAVAQVQRELINLELYHRASWGLGHTASRPAAAPAPWIGRGTGEHTVAAASRLRGQPRPCAHRSATACPLARLCPVHCTRSLPFAVLGDVHEAAHVPCAIPTPAGNRRQGQVRRAQER